MLRSFLLFFAVVCIALTPKAIQSVLAQDTGMTGIPVKATADSQAKAKKLYAVDCAMCHGDNGNGQTDLAKSMNLKLADWTDPKSLAAKPNQDLFDMIRKGKDTMPAEADGRAKNDDVWNLIIYIRKMSTSQPMEPAK